MRRNPIPAAALLLAAACSDAVAPSGTTRSEPLASTAAATSVTVVMSNLDSPRGLAWGPGGDLYVAEAGKSAVNGPCAPIARGTNCFSGTGAISRLRGGAQSRVVQGLPSLYNPVTMDIGGPQDVAFGPAGQMFATVGWGGDPAARELLGAAGRGFGTLIAIPWSGPWHPVADVAAFEKANNPAGGPEDSNPFGLMVAPGGFFVADAGGNSVVFINRLGRVWLQSVLPPVPAPPPFMQAEAVPTAVARGPDGALYVSTLTGVPFTVGAAGIYRIAEHQPPQLVAGGFKMITDFTVGPDGSLYVLQYASDPVFLGGFGSLVKVAPDGSRTVLTTALTHPTSVALAPNGDLYVSNHGDAESIGEVLRVVP